MTSNARKMIAAAALVATTFGLVAQPTFAHSSPASQPAQTIRNLSLKLPIGTIELLDANLQVKTGESNQPEGFRGTARVKLPAVGPLANLQMSDLLRADVGLDKGAALTSFGAPLDPERRYFFIEFGGGLNVSREVKDSEGETQKVDLAVPPGQRVVLIVDPEQPLIFVQGKVNVSYTGDLAVIGDLLAARGIDLGALDNVQMPGVATIMISGTLAPGTDKSFLELKTGTGISAGAIGAAIGVQAEPLALQGGVRIDKDGVTVTGVTASRVAPSTVLDGSGKVQVRVPFDGQQPFIDLTGALSVPLAQVETEGTQRVTVDGQAVADAVAVAADAVASAARSAGNAVTVTVESAANAVGDAAQSAGGLLTVTVGSASAAIGGAAKSAGDIFTVTVESVAQAGGSAVAGVKDVVSNTVGASPVVSGVKDIVSTTVGAAAPVISGAKDVVSTTVGAASSTVGTGWQTILQQVCKATGRC